MLSDTAEAKIHALGGLVPARGGKLEPLRDGDCDAIEARFGQSLPADYRSFVTKYGGGMFANLARCDINQSRFVYVGVYYGDGDDESSPFHIKWAMSVFCEQMPTNFLPIAESAGGDGQFCLGVAGSEYGKVFFWDRDEGWSGEEAEYRTQGKPFPEELKFQNMTLLADLFEAFLLRLIPKEE
ncbi:MAG TPA: SMI1/KNR4 family protein [Urbifossiella sp.]|nr:SMI1/KNR4 family protein [Urbifossiella sp.]